MLFAGVRGRLDGLDVGAVLDYLDLADVAFWTAQVGHVCRLRRDLPHAAAAWMAAVGALDAAASGALGKMRMDPRGSELLGLMCDVGERRAAAIAVVDGLNKKQMKTLGNDMRGTYQRAADDGDDPMCSQPPRSAPGARRERGQGVVQLFGPNVRMPYCM